MEIHFKFIGVLLIILALVHAIFPRYFNWKTNLASLSLINRQMMVVHTFFIALTVLIIGLLCITSAPELIHTPLGRKVSVGLGIFWFVRLIVQLFGYSSQLWKGKRFETLMHLVFSVLWIYLSVVFLGNGLGYL